MIPSQSHIPLVGGPLDGRAVNLARSAAPAEIAVATRVRGGFPRRSRPVVASYALRDDHYDFLATSPR
jgi:hypothetical protein